MDPVREHLQAVTRRHFCARSALGLGTAALASLSSLVMRHRNDPEESSHRNKRVGGLPDLPHFPPKAKRAIYLFMGGGPSQPDLFDYKPRLAEWYDHELPESVRGDRRLAGMSKRQERLPVAPPKFAFRRHGRSGTWVSELLPWTARVVDDLAIIKSMYTEEMNHDPAITYICTGQSRPGNASLGAWLSYGLGTENENLPAFVVMTPNWSSRGNVQALYNRLWGSGFLPSCHQGTALRAHGDPILFLANPPGIDKNTRRRMLDSLARLNQKHFKEVGDPETQSRMEQYETAFRMQTSVPELTDLSREPKHILDLYGPEVHKPGSFAASCLLARRLIERDVRFVQIFHRGWDQHLILPRQLPRQCRDIDQPCYGLITDLKRSGLLDDTLIIWGGEFGRTIYCQGKLTADNYGRDHHGGCFTMWMAGGGVKPGISYGATDDFSYNVVENPVHIHDLNSTILHCLGIDHKRLTYPSQGLDVRLTGVEDHHRPVFDLLT